METVQYGHPENIMPFCVRSLKIYDRSGNMLASVDDNHKTIVDVEFREKLSADRLRIEFENCQDNVPVSVFGIFIK